MTKTTSTSSNEHNSDYSLAQEFITDASGHIRKVVIDLADYQKMLATLQDERLYRAMAEVHDETPLSLSEALRELETS